MARSPVPPMSPLAAWATSLAATAASTYALDVWAAATGAGLVASGFLTGLDHRSVVMFLLASYVVWVFGLRANLRANATLLAATGASTNVLSKLAYDVTRRRFGDGRTTRLAAAVAYTGTEIAKEVPYYVAAFGAAAATDAITTDEALVFLAGANLGAALYEVALAGLTRTVLSRRRTHASFDRDWVPAEYLTDYYRTVEPDEIATIAFLVNAMHHAERDQPILYFGSGPTLHHVFACAERASEIHLGDYLPENLAEIQRWIDRAPGAHDWRPFVRYTLQCEGNTCPTDDEITEREDLTRAKITTLVRVDARHPRPVNRNYPTVVSAYCADSATGDRTTWELFMRHITGLVQPGGLFLTAALRRCRGYTVGGKTFPGADIDERDLRAALHPDFEPLHEEVIPTSQHDSHGYAGILLCQARRTQPAPAAQAAIGLSLLDPTN
ncbi:guanitoxin biosynthesis pre-guanitoxin forming N-methyltransferase GntF [Actinoplanes sp. NPDC051861]|uniref:guanitoxin biosynthesis pre-guanitoxin forming N-methyltransferase GntF n=1 Tax=Actinoplanes sp. NPDC051861 TaxID=3155170 RepID=UPI003434D441